MHHIGQLVAPSIKRLPNSHEIQLEVDCLSNARLLDMEKDIPVRLSKAKLFGSKVNEQMLIQLQAAIQSAKIRRGL